MDLRNNFKANCDGIQHLGIPTNDLEATKAFYDSIGFDVIFEKPGEVAFIKLGTLVIETYPAKEGAKMESGAIDHVSINVKDVEAALKDAQALGHEPLEGQITFLPFFDNGVKFFTILGPNKEKIEFNQYL